LIDLLHEVIQEEGVHCIQKPFSLKDLGAKLREELND
jgi:hypothetical protein